MAGVVYNNDKGNYRVNAIHFEKELHFRKDQMNFREISQYLFFPGALKKKMLKLIMSPSSAKKYF